MIYFDECDAIVNGTGILATQASLSISNSLTPIKTIGKRGALTQSAQSDLTANLQLNYFLETDNEPNYELVQEIKNFFLKDEIYSPKQLVIGGISGEYYLNSYSIQAKPNEIITAAASYLNFGGVSGSFAKKNSSITYNKSNGNNIGAFVFITETGNYLENKTLSFEYNFACTWQPINVIGQRKQVEVKLLSAEEKITVEKEKFSNLSFSGDKASLTLFNSDETGTIKIYGFKFACSKDTSFGKEISLSGFRINQSEVGVAVDGFLTNKISFNKYY